MRKLTEEEFQDRAQAILRAQRIFIDSGMTKEIGMAFRLYQGVCAERERVLFLSSQHYGGRPPTIMDRYDRPKCPECGSDMMFRQVPENEAGIKTQLVCSKKDCDTVLNDEHDLTWWMSHLKRKQDEPE